MWIICYIINIQALILFYNLMTEEMAEKQFVDAKDKQGDWQVGYILQLHPNHIQLRYDGFSSKFDEAFPHNSHKLKPFRTITKGYTGMRKTLPPRQHWKFSLHDHHHQLTRLAHFLGNLAHQTSRQIDQFLRGHHYFYLDFLLTNNYAQDQIQPVYQYFKMHIDFVIQYLHEIVNSPSWMATHYHQGYYEYLDALCIVFAMYPRHSSYHRNNQKVLRQWLDQMSHESYLAGYLNSRQFLEWYMKVLERVGSQPTVAICFIYSLNHLYFSLERVIIAPKETKQSIANTLFQIIHRHFLTLDINVLRNDEKEVEMLLTQTKMLSSKYGDKTIVYKWVDQTKLKIYSLMLLLDSLEKRVKAISKIKEFLEGIIFNQPSYLLTKEDFRKFIEGDRILSIIFEHNQHIEVIKKGCQLAKMLFHYHVITTQDLLFIWNACTSKHEAVRKSINQLWLEIDIKSPFIKQLVQVVIHQNVHHDWQIEFLIQFAGKLIRKDEQNEATAKVLTLAYQSALKNVRYLELFSKVLGRQSRQNSKMVEKLMKECLMKMMEGDNNTLHMQLMVDIMAESYGKQISIPLDAIQILIKQITIMVQQNHLQHLHLAFQLLNEILHANSKQTQLSFNDFQDLWTIFIHARTNHTKDIFYSWIITESTEGYLKTKTKQINAVLSPTLIINIFRKILINPTLLNYSTLTIEQFHIFEEFMLKVNQLSNKIDINDHVSGLKIFRVKNTSIEGMDELWRMVDACKESNLIEAISLFIKNLYLNTSDKVPTCLKLSQIDTLLTKIYHNIKVALDNSHILIIKHNLILLIKLIQDINSKITMSVYPNSAKTIVKFYQQHQPLQQLQSHILEPLFIIKNKIANHLSIPLDEFTLYNRDQEIPKECYSFPLYTLHIHDHHEGLKVVRADNHIKKLTFQFIKSNLNDYLEQLLSNEEVCQEAYNILNETKNGTNEAKFVENVLEKNVNLGTQTIYFNLYFLHLSNLHHRRHNIIHKIITQISLQINSDVTLQFTHSFLEILIRVIQEGYQHQSLPQIIIQVMMSFFRFINQKAKQLQRRRQSNLLMLLMKCLELCLKETILEFLVNHPAIEDILKCIYIQHKHDWMKMLFCNKLQLYCKNYRVSQEDSNKLLAIVYSKMYDNVMQNRENMNYYSTFFKMFSFTIQLATAAYILSLTQLYQHIITCIRSEPPQCNEETNAFLDGHLQLLSSIYNKCPTLIDESILHYLMEDCLALTTKLPKLIHKCTSPTTITTCFKLLYIISTHNQHLNNYVVERVLQSHQITYWRTPERWNVSIDDEKKSQTGYVGLENPGCICYLNSFMQQLFMIQPFRNSVLEVQAEDQTILSSLKILFINLLYSQKQSLNPLFFVDKIRDANNNPIIKLFEQMDIDQYCAILFDRIESCLSQGNNFVRGLFGGIYSNEILSKECSHSSERQQSFLSICLEVKRSVIESLESLVKQQMLEGENAYYCERCDKKVKAIKRLSLKVLPQFLMITLKRFEFNFESDTKYKINGYCQFPMLLDLTSFSHQTINSNLPPQHPNQFQYKLKGIVVHSGYADSGHYYSLIQRDNKWYQFNDHKVVEFDVECIPEEAFGGKANGETHKIKNAYILIYQRIKPSPIPSLPPPNHPIIDSILRENQTIHNYRILFSKEYSHFINQITHIKHEYKYYSNNVLLIVYFLTVCIRKKQLSEILQVAKEVIDRMKIMPKLGVRYLQEFSQERKLQQFFMQGCLVSEKNRIMAYTIIDTIQQLLGKTNQQKQAYTISINNFLTNALQLMTIKQSNPAYICFIIKKVSMHNQYIPQYLIQQHILNIILNNITHQSSNHHNAFTPFKHQHPNSLITQSNHHSQQSIKSSDRESWELLCVMFEHLVEMADDVQQVTNKLMPITHQQLINLMIESTPKAILAMSKFIGQCSINNIQITTNILQAIKKALKELQFINYRPFLLCLYQQIFINDQLMEQRIKTIIQLLKQSLEINQKHLIECHLIHQWILKMCCHSHVFFQLLKHHPIIDYILKVNSPTKTSPHQFLRRHKNNISQKLVQRYHGIMVSLEFSDYEQLLKEQMDKFEQIKQGMAIKMHYPIEPSPNEVYLKGKDIQYFRYSEWMKGIVVENTFGFLTIQLQDGLFTLWEDSENIKLLTPKIE